MAGARTAQGGEGRTGAPAPQDAERSPAPPPPPRGLPGLRFWLVAGGLVVLLGGALYLLYGSPWLKLTRVSVTGTEMLTPREVERAVAAPVGSPLVSADTDALAARTRARLPRVESVEITRSWPHGLRVSVTERKPVLVREKGGKFDEVDAHGVLFATVGTPPRGIPRLDLDASGAPSLHRFGTARLLREAATIAARVPSPVVKNLRTIRIRSYDDVALLLRDGRTVAWGSGEKSAAKARTLTALMKAEPKAEYYDVSVPVAPSVRGS
ncbi:cell division protein FtsQ/DivIB [Streptomyces sp. SPB074]|uniref:cell division protein FtsQ/DivIB n=1 Tax=Streptomyces sp. (strain SPB074) TaxID=465543 RepID=UPI00017F27E3|nr:FtsQ-type POTRA domain-containing protein [Streptomyces sp. SPB074]EDY45687.1 cell division protein FtsQ [Streptomyces sp. SPB074]